MKIAMRFEGGDELAANLAKLSMPLSKKIVREALLEAAEPIRAMAARIAPHAPGAPDLRDHIAVAPVRSSELGAVAVGPTREFYYGFFQEFGTKHHGAHAFMRPAFDTQAEKALGVLGKALWRELASRGISRTATVSGPVQSLGRLL